MLANIGLPGLTATIIGGAPPWDSQGFLGSQGVASHDLIAFVQEKMLSAMQAHKHFKTMAARKGWVTMLKGKAGTPQHMHAFKGPMRGL